jgi:uncharacterized protein
VTGILAPIRTDIFVIPLLERYLVYAPLRRTAFITNAAGVNLVRRLRQGEVAPASEDESDFLKFCREVRLTGNEGDWPITTLQSTAFQPADVTLFLTTRCNLRCIYCYASAGELPRAEMSLTTAKRGIDFVCRNALEAGKKSFGVGYHGGGEPTLNWRVMTQSFEYARRVARENGIKVFGSMASNGVLSPRKLQWIIENFRGVNLSIDGLPEVQDRQRLSASGKATSSAALRTMRAFDEAAFSYGIRMTVTSASVHLLPRSVEFLLEKGHPKHIQVEPVYELGRGRETGLEVDPKAFVEAFREAKSIARSSGTDFFYSAARADVLSNRFCQSCGEGFSLTPQGLVSACYEVPDATFEFAKQFIIGQYEESEERYRFSQSKLQRLRDHTVERIAWCKGCFCKWHCAGDCAYKSRHAAVNGRFLGDARCEITRALTLDQILEKIAESGGKVWAARPASG